MSLHAVPHYSLAGSLTLFGVQEGKISFVLPQLCLVMIMHALCMLVQSQHVELNLKQHRKMHSRRWPIETAPERQESRQMLQVIRWHGIDTSTLHLHLITTMMTCYSPFTLL